MDQFKVLYYPNSACNMLTLVKSMLVFDEMTFFDHPSLNFGEVGTIGHASGMDHMNEHLEGSGFKINVVAPFSGIVEDELRQVIDADLQNPTYRAAFFELMHRDPSFITDLVPNGDYGNGLDHNQLRQSVLATASVDMPSSIEEINQSMNTSKPSAKMLIGTSMALDSYKMSFATYHAINHGLQLFGDSEAMDMLLNAKLGSEPSEDNASVNISHQLAFTLMEHLISDKAILSHSLKEMMLFRSQLQDERIRFQEHMLMVSSELKLAQNDGTHKDVEAILHAKLLPEVRKYESAIRHRWTKFFKDTSTSVLNDGNHISQIIITSYATKSLAAVLLASLARVTMKTVPNVIGYLEDKAEMQVDNPYTYLMSIRSRIK